MQVVTFLKEMMKVVITHMEADVPEVWGMFRTLLNPKMPFYANHGQDCVPPPPPRYDSDSDSEAAATGTAPWMKAGDTINMNLGGSLIKAKVLELSPTNTEVNLSFVELGATQWLSVDDERLTPLDAEHPTTAAPDAATDAAAAAAEAEEDPEKAAELARQRAAGRLALARQPAGGRPELLLLPPMRGEVLASGAATSPGSEAASRRLPPRTR